MPTQNIIVGRYPEDRERFKEKATGFIGKHYVGTKKDAYLANNILIDFLRPHLIGIFGKRGTGKSYTLGVIAEELMEIEEEFKKNISVVVFDTMGVYWSMKYPNKQAKSLLLEWGLEPKEYDIKIAIPLGVEKKYIAEDIDYDVVFSFAPYELTSSDWNYIFGIDANSLEGILLEKALSELQEKEKEYTIDDIIRTLESIEQSKESKILINKFESSKSWGIFSDKSISLKQLIKPSTTTIIDLSQFGLESGGWSVRSLVVGLLSRKILNARIESRRIEEQEKILGENLRDQYENYIPLTWILIDEAHQFLPAQGETAATLPLLQVIKIGRQPGVSLVVATQMPFKLHQEAISQADLVIAHRLTAKKDILALSEIMQTYQKYSLADYFDAMPRQKGSAIILDDNSERIYEVRIRPRKSWHAGESAIAFNEH